jgi:hypothetical protein
VDRRLRALGSEAEDALHQGGMIARVGATVQVGKGRAKYLSNRDLNPDGRARSRELLNSPRSPILEFRTAD